MNALMAMLKQVQEAVEGAVIPIFSSTTVPASTVALQRLSAYITRISFSMNVNHAIWDVKHV